MNKLTFSTSMAALLLSTGAAFAADVSAPAAHDWSGFYIGANAGAAWSNGDVKSNYLNVDPRPSPDPQRVARILEGTVDGETAFTGGGIVGFNYQIDRIVLGVEADFNYLGFGDSVNKTYITPDIGQIVIPDEYSHLEWSADWYGTIRARLGYAIDNFMIYGTGGVAYGDVQASGNMAIGEKTYLKGSADGVQWGWTVGGGAEYALNDHLSVGAEYLYVDLGSSKFDYKEVSTIDFEADAEVDYRFSVARATIKYSF